MRPSFALRARGFWTIARSAVSAFSRRGGGLLAGSVAFHSLLSILPVLFIALWIASLGAREEHTRATIVTELGRWIGPAGAATMADLLGRDQAGGSLLTRLFHAGVLAYMSTQLFTQLRRSINHLWDVEPLPTETVKQSLLKKAQRLAASFFIVLLIEAVLLALVAVKTGLSVATSRYAPALETSLLVHSVEVLLSFGVVTLLFATMLRYLPDARTRWRDLWVGALVTSSLFCLGAHGLGEYLSHKAMESAFGDGGALVMLLLWVNYSAQIFFLGVSFTGVWAERRGGGIRPVHGARRVPPPVA
jgi:membrane protein